MTTADWPLATLQHWMQGALIHPAATPRETIDAMFEASPRLSAAGRLAIYQRSYAARLLRCLDEQFPALRHALGPDLFADFAREYLRECPSQAYTLYGLGARFPGWLQRNRPDRDQAEQVQEDWIDFMVDLATFERTMFQMFDSPGNEGRPFATQSTLDARLRLQPCFALLAARYPVAEYYHAVRAARAPAFPPRTDSWFALVRKDYRTRTIRLRWPQYVFLDAMWRGLDMNAALDAVAHASGLSRANVGAAWTAPDSSRSTWIESGVFVAGEA
jgi:hypothetical protein